MKKMFLISLVMLSTVGLMFYLGSQSVTAQHYDPLQAQCAEFDGRSVSQRPAACLGRDQSHDRNSIYGSGGTLAKVTSLIAMVVGIASVIMIIVGGIMYVLSTGDATNLNNAKNTIIYALVGLAIAGIAQMLVVFVIRRVT